MAATKQFLKTAAGKKVYSNGSHAPTKGTVNPKGYIKRSIVQSNRRSGLAAAALRRKKNAAIKHKPAPKPKPKPAPKPIAKPAAPKPVLNKPATTGTQTTTSGHPVATTVPVVSPDPVQQPANPYISINSNGQLDLPYNQQYSMDVLQGAQGMNQQLLDLQTQGQQEANDYNSQGRDMDSAYGKQQDDTLSQDAGRGLGFSSIHGAHVADQATAYNNQRTDLDTQHNTALQNEDLQRMQIQNNFNAMLQQSALQNASTQSASAGTLGYGKGTATPMAVPKVPVKTPTSVPKPVAKPKPKPKPKKKHAKAAGKKIKR